MQQIDSFWITICHKVATEVTLRVLAGQDIPRDNTYTTGSY